MAHNCLEGMDNHLPPNLRKSLQVIMSGSSDSKPTSEKVDCFVSSKEHDSFIAVTNGKLRYKSTFLPKPLCQSFISLQLHTAVNKLSHTESYTFSLEIFDYAINDQSGNCSTHTAYGIVLQELDDSESNNPEGEEGFSICHSCQEVASIHMT